MKKMIVLMVMAAMMATFTACGEQGKSVHSRGLLQPSKRVEQVEGGLLHLVCK